MSLRAERPARRGDPVPDDDVEIVRDDEASRYRLLLGGGQAGFAKFRASPGRIIFTHTVVDPAFEGRGLGSMLAKWVVEDAIRRGERIVPRCPFIAAWLRKHPGYEESIDWPGGQPVNA
ncbi:N-acetyltransferase [Agromyces binzhouensis]|uniref:N-acetyltransferase n=1 Tax=Agromyces binzhouensis TaxID=1817495 RepID=A0A4Q2JE43_9MICO|nr:N-acetyltransferase [Agromyces binzhouensis]